MASAPACVPLCEVGGVLVSAFLMRGFLPSGLPLLFRHSSVLLSGRLAVDSSHGGCHENANHIPILTLVHAC